MATKVRRIKTLDDLETDDKNANLGTARGAALLDESLQLYGAGRSVLADRFGRLIAGNKTVQQARALKLPVRIVQSRGRELVVVQREDLDLKRDPRARALAIADNRIAELDLAWDPKILAELREGGLDLKALWSPEEWADFTGSSVDADGKEDVVLAPASTNIRRGDLFALGEHRLLCGDATSLEDVTRLLAGNTPGLMSTDPPYGIDYDPGWRNKAYPKQRTAVGAVMNDDQAAWPAAFLHFPGDVVYAWHAGLRAPSAAGALEKAGFRIRAQIIWVKSHFVLSRGAYHQGHEPAFYAVRQGRSAPWHGDRSQSTVWTVQNLNPIGGNRTGDNAPTGHSTQKPVRLFEIPILNHTVRGGAVYDPFVGSGTTIIAAEKTGRVALAMDLDEKYVQTALTRWETFTGKRARKLPAAKRLR
jgi:DNA modification methylase